MKNEKESKEYFSCTSIFLKFLDYLSFIERQTQVSQIVQKFLHMLFDFVLLAFQNDDFLEQITGRHTRRLLMFETKRQRSNISDNGINHLCQLKYKMCIIKLQKHKQDMKAWKIKNLKLLKLINAKLYLHIYSLQRWPQASQLISNLTLTLPTRMSPDINSSVKITNHGFKRSKILLRHCSCWK